MNAKASVSMQYILNLTLLEQSHHKPMGICGGGMLQGDKVNKHCEDVLYSLSS